MRGTAQCGPGQLGSHPAVVGGQRPGWWAGRLHAVSLEGPPPPCPAGPLQPSGDAAFSPTFSLTVTHGPRAPDSHHLVWVSPWPARQRLQGQSVLAQGAPP